MNEENKTPQGTTETETDPATHYAEELRKIRESSVPRQQYDDLKKQNDTLARSLANRTFAPPEEKKAEPEPVDLDKLRKRLFTTKQRGLAFWTDAITLQEELAKRTPGYDMFAGSGASSEPPSTMAREASAQLQRIVKECIDLANGDPDVFDAHLQSRIVQPAFVRR